MGKKLIALVLILSVSGAASATTLTLTRSGSGTLNTNDTERIYVWVDDSGLDSLVATMNVTNGTFSAGMSAADSVDYGVQATSVPTSWGGGTAVTGGWQSGLSFDTDISNGNTTAELGFGHFGSTLYGPTDTFVIADVPENNTNSNLLYNISVAWIELQAAGTGDMVLSWNDGSQFGQGSTIVTGGSPIFGPSLTVSAVPEPMTIALLGLGGLFLRRRKLNRQ